MSERTLMTGRESLLLSVTLRIAIVALILSTITFALGVSRLSDVCVCSTRADPDSLEAVRGVNDGQQEVAEQCLF